MVVIFDFDGVINKSEYFSIKYEKEFGVPREAFLPFFQREFEQCAKGEVDIKKCLPAYLEQWKWHGSVESFLDYWFNNDIKLDLELLNLVDQIKQKGHYVVLASQQEINRRNHIWEALGLKNIFHQFYCTCDLGYTKSEVEFYLAILEDLKAQEIIQSSTEVIFFDDSINFVNAAQKVGIESFHVKGNDDIFERISKIFQHSF